MRWLQPRLKVQGHEILTVVVRSTLQIARSVSQTVRYFACHPAGGRRHWGKVPLGSISLSVSS